MLSHLLSSSERAHARLEPDLVDELHLLPYPLTLGGGKRLLPADVHATFALQSLCPYPTGVVGLHYAPAPTDPHGDEWLARTRRCHYITI